MGVLLNLIGLGAAIALYAMLLVMVVHAGRAPTARAHADPLLLATAILGLAWNLCALPAYALARLGIGGSVPWLTLIGTSALGFLAAVVVHSVLRGERRGVERAVARGLLAAAYGAATIAVLLHVRGLFTGTALPSPAAMRLLTFVFIALFVPVAWVTRRQQRSRRALWVAALSAFAVSSLHLSQADPANPSWVVELVGHHASLPLAIAILYQDFPFAFADLFLKRVLALTALMAVPLVAIALVGLRPSAATLPVSDPRVVSILVVVWLTTLFVYPPIRGLTEWFVDAVILRHPDYQQVRARMSAIAQRHEDTPAMLDEVCEELARAISAGAVRWKEMATRSSAEWRGPLTARIDVPVAEPPGYRIEISELVGGRRLLSDDYAFLDATAGQVARRIDALRITRERYARELRDQEVAKLATEAELRALRAQINPHFLFNALTTIGYLIQTSPPRALRMLMRLTSLLRGVLRSDGELTALDREIDLVEAYLDIERARFEQRLRVTIDVSEAARLVRIPPLIVQPLVENAVKHGIARTAAGGDVHILGSVVASPDGAPALALAVRDTGAGATAAELRHGRASGVGLANVERRLACYYGASASLSLASEAGVGTCVEIRLPAAQRAAAGAVRTA